MLNVNVNNPKRHLVIISVRINQHCSPNKDQIGLENQQVASKYDTILALKGLKSVYL